MSLEAQDSPTTRTTCRILILLFIVISVQTTVHVNAFLTDGRIHGHGEARGPLLHALWRTSN